MSQQILHYASQKSRKEDDNEIMFIDDIYKIVEHAIQVRDKSESVAATVESHIRTDNYICTALTSVARRMTLEISQYNEFEILPSRFFNREEALTEPGMLLITAEMQGPTKAIIDADDRVIAILNSGPTGATDWKHVTNPASMDEAAKLFYGPEYDQEPLGNSGHLIIWDLRLAIEFPPGATFAIPSAVLRHSNGSTQKGEKRFSITQYTSAGLFRFVNNDFQTDITGKASMSKAEEREFAAAAGQRRYSEGIEMHSTLEELKMRAFM
ncbi:hypothetical protein MSAN_02360600 [Mycena sanguinolenta]|uniref:Uncharacterized protein n=1 Tax=Mycena sanguinolenta TaxID=230812 RepID=A0A8H7CGR3_9AGAR|nr:hypothetical protein MSAN_02360600 [Mycena sanguinolenta]